MADRNCPQAPEERQVMFDLATGFVAYKSGSDVPTAATFLSQLIERGEVVIRGDVNDAYLEVSGVVIIHTDRDWLAIFAAYPWVELTETVRRSWLGRLSWIRTEPRGRPVNTLATYRSLRSGRSSSRQSSMSTTLASGRCAPRPSTSAFPRHRKDNKSAELAN